MSNGNGYTFSRHIESVVAALDLLDCFLESQALSTKELIDLTGMTRNRVMRLVGTLIAKGYLIHHKEDNRFSLGPKAMALGRAFLDSQDLVRLARPILRELSQISGESASIYISQESEMVVLLREESSQSIRYSVREGQRMPLHAGAPGKTLLAFSEAGIVDQILAQGKLEQLTPNTITGSQDYQEELAKIREQGFATSLGERVLDAAAVAAPVFNHLGNVVGALSLAGPITRFTQDKTREYSGLVIQFAKRLSKLLGHSA